MMWLIGGLLIATLGFIGQVLCPMWKDAFPDSGVMLVKERFEIACGIFAAFYVLYFFCSLATGDLHIR